MKTFDVAGGADRDGGEHVLGAKETGSHACYLIYGRLKPGEGGRVICPGKGHEEIILAVRGDLEVTGGASGTLKEGFALHLTGDVKCYLKNPSNEDAIYVASGGHSEGGGHHH